MGDRNKKFGSNEVWWLAVGHPTKSGGQRATADPSGFVLRTKYRTRIAIAGVDIHITRDLANV